MDDDSPSPSSRLGPESVAGPRTASGKQRSIRERPLPLHYLLGSEARRDLVDVFVTMIEPDEALNMTEIAERAGMHRQTVSNNIDDLVAFGIAEEQGEGIVHYSPNVDSPTFQVLFEAHRVFGDFVSENDVNV